MNRPEPPETNDLQPQMMTAAELTRRLEAIFGWLNEIEALPDGTRNELYPESLIDDVRSAGNALLVERRERHSDEHAPRGG